MANILDIVRGNEQQQNNVNKLRELCSKKNVWDYFGLGKEDFLNLSDSKQSQLTSTFYFENIYNPKQESIDTSVGSIINSSSSINLKKSYKNGKNRTEMSLSTTKKEEKKQNLLPCGQKMFFLQTNAAILAWKKLICLRIPFFM